MSPRQPLIVGNWKLHKKQREAEELALEIRGGLTQGTHCEVAVAPPFTALSTVRAALDGSGILLGAQNCYWEDQGAYTGEVSVPLLADTGCQLVIVGHSERRQLFGDTDEAVRRKIAAVLSHGLTPVACVGETLEERERHATLGIVLRQLDAALDGAGHAAADMAVAYEPVWAIGTGRTASPGDAQEVHAAIRGRIETRCGATIAGRVRILYGGSVKPDNARALLGQPDIDGALVGGASLTANSFLQIVRSAE